MKRYLLICSVLCVSTAYPSESLVDDGIRFYFGDPSFGAMLSDVPLRSKDGFQFILTTNVSVSVLTCRKDYDYVKDQMHWKMVIKHSKSPLKQSIQVQDKLKGIQAGLFSAYLNPKTAIETEKSAIAIIYELDHFNKTMSNNLNVDAIGRGDPDTHLTAMQITVSKVSEGKQSFFKGSYVGLPDSKRTEAFELYEKAFAKLLVLSGL